MIPPQIEEVKQQQPPVEEVKEQPLIVIAEEIKQQKVEKDIKPTPGAGSGVTYGPKLKGKKEEYQKQVVEFPNQQYYPDNQGFWSQDIINMFICENWS